MVQTRSQTKSQKSQNLMLARLMHTRLYFASLYKELKDKMFLNHNFTENRNVYKYNGKNIGLELYKLGGSQLLFDTMRILVEDIMDRDSIHESIYYTDLRNLEMEWSGIGEWRA
jgi:hypothetical protein